MLICKSKHLSANHRPGDACPQCNEPFAVYVHAPAMFNHAMQAVLDDGVVIGGVIAAPNIASAAQATLANFEGQGLAGKVVALTIQRQNTKLVGPNGAALALPTIPRG